MLAIPATAQTAPEADILPRLIGTGCFDLVDDLNGCEQVTLLSSDEAPGAADLLIYPDRRTDDAEGPLLIVRDIAFSGPMWGQAPSLEQIAGGFRLRTEQSGIGRYPWFESIDVAHDGHAFIITAYSYSSYDRMMGAVYNCEVDFSLGTYWAERETPDMENEDADPVIERRSGTIAPQPLPLQTWSETSPRPTTCSDSLAAP